MTNTHIMNKYASAIKTKKLIKQAQAAEITLGSIVGLLALLAAGGYGIDKYYRNKVDDQKKKVGYGSIPGGMALGAGAGIGGNVGLSKFIDNAMGKNPGDLNALEKLFVRPYSSGNVGTKKWADPLLLKRHGGGRGGKMKYVARAAGPVLGALGLGAGSKAVSDSIVEHNAAKEHPIMSSISELISGR
jgi:hypothetical protein